MHVPTRAPSTSSTPPVSVALPPELHGTASQPGSSVAPAVVSPENSVPTVGARITSPSLVSATYVFGTQFWPFVSHVVARVPALKSTDAVSCSVCPGIVKLGASDTAAFPDESIDVMRKKYVAFGVKPVSVTLCCVTSALLVADCVSAGGSVGFVE